MNKLFISGCLSVRTILCWVARSLVCLCLVFSFFSREETTKSTHHTPIRRCKAQRLRGTQNLSSSNPRWCVVLCSTILKFGWTPHRRRNLIYKEWLYIYRFIRRWVWVSGASVRRSVAVWLWLLVNSALSTSLRSNSPKKYALLRFSFLSFVSFISSRSVWLYE